MGKHNPADRPRTGDGRTNRTTQPGGRDIGRAEVKLQTSTGAWLWKQTARLWNGKKRK